MLITLAFGLIYLAFLPPGIYSLDGNGMLGVAESLVARHSWAVPADLGIPGRDGQFFGKWYPLLSILAVPFVAIAREAAQIFRVPVHYLAAILALILPIAFSAATATLVLLISVRLGSSAKGAIFAALSYAFGTIALAYARTFYAEPLLALLTAGAIYAAMGASRRQVVCAAICSTLAVLAKPTGILVGPLITVYLLATSRSWRLSVIPGLGSFAGLAIYCVYNYERFGHPLTFGQPWSFAISAIPEGLAGLLLSPGRGLLWYCPPLVLSIAAFRKARQLNSYTALLIVGVFAGFLSLHSLWSYWSGGWSWGPRFLLPAIPGLAALLGFLEANWRRAVIGLTAIGFLINAPTLVTYYERYYAEMNERQIPEHEMLWSFSRAPFLHVWPAAIRQIEDARHSDVRGLFSERGEAPASTVAASRALRIVAVWWWVLPVVHVPRVMGAAVSVLLCGCGCILLLRQFRLLLAGPPE
jgi:hypothetical protein